MNVNHHTTGCPDCGANQINHFFAHFSAWMNHHRMQKYRPVEKFRKLFGKYCEPQTDLLFLAFIRISCALRIGKFLNEPDEKTCGRGAFLWEKAPARGIKMQEFRFLGRPVDTYIAEFNGKRNIFEGLPRPNGRTYPSLDWMDNKAMIRKQFVPAGIPMAKGGETSNFEEAIAIWNSVPKPVITKPHVGSRSRHTTIHIETEKELGQAWKNARKLSPWVIVEQELHGFQYRGTAIGGKTVAVLRRDPACVIGDGKLSVRELLEKENKNPKRQGPIYHMIVLDETAEHELKRQGLSWESVPAKNQCVPLGVKASRGAGGGTTDVTRETHPDNIALFEKVAEVLDDPLVGVDFIIADISKSWKEQDACGVIECNSMPFIDLHKNPLVGVTQDAASPLWDVVFPESKQKKNSQ